ncbi:class 1 isoprenoid biosynthesis enzyme [Draconibacterium sp. IB214405]|uniref:class 1 isoprenoid biosynthesis enzyme n=1 Tax=Draconibacterium sp. IB214405 TaxID=3097352 RepID=UPI002A0EC71E|nr:class 1 isoprenoid biosynthesis enzyme [Draconibacterium sp. IB214405]MDX8339910.1 class 1 isoprenoid biosynthesis enzyme [Draconibacterium sp. IB214405]
MLPVQEYIDYFKEIWNNSSEALPRFNKAYSREEKLKHESNFDSFQNKLKELQNVRKAQQMRKDPAKSFFPMFHSFLKTVFDFDSAHLEIILSDEFKDVSKDFFYQARAFAPELSAEDIYQGMRNVWIMNGLQLMAHKPVKITPSVFAYSMIYPYSDNLLDDPDISSKQKVEFSERFDLRLRGNSIKPQNFTEEQLYKLISMFEEEFPRNEFQNVYESLYAIQRGQTNSLKLSPQNGLSDDEISTICFEKGGASVLADGYLVAGKLTMEQERALFGYGIYLQLLDDIQDVKEDSLAFTKTMFSCLEEKDLGKFVNKTIHFGREVLEEMSCFEGTQTDAFIGLMNRSIETMIIESVGLNHSWYDKSYLKQIEQFSPLHYSYLRKKRAQGKSQRFALLQKYFDSSEFKLAV